MSAVICLSTTFWDHYKTRQTIEALGLEGVRSLQILWIWAAGNRPDGILENMTWQQIEMAADWKGEPKKFFDACLGIWIDECNGEYSLHDWMEYNADCLKKRKRKITAKSDAGKCPHQKIIDIYHETLPTLPRVAVWTGTRQGNLLARWREAWGNEYEDMDGGLKYWQNLFIYIRDNCPFLMGKKEFKDGNTFKASLDWIVRPNNFAKIVEGRYARG